MKLLTHRLRGWRALVAGLVVTALASAGLVFASGQANAAVSLDTSKYYVLVNVNSGKALDLWEWSTASGGEFRQYTRSDAENQQFQFISSGNGYYRLKNRYSGMVVDVWGWSTSGGAEVNQAVDNDYANQQWKLTGPNNDKVRFINNNSGMALAVEGSSTEDGGDITQHTDDSTNTAMQWQMIAVDDVDSGSGSDTDELVGWATQNGGTTGGSSSNVVNVSTASAFLSAISSSTSQTVRLTANITLSGMNDVASNKTIIGADDGVTITGGGLQLDGVSNVIIRNLAFTGWDDDGINMEQGTTNVWVDHCSFSDGYDGALDIKRASDYITVSWNYFTDHDKNMLLGHSDSNSSQDTGHLRVTYHHNFFDGTVQRNPRVRFGNPVHVYNNYYYANDGYGVAATEDSGVLVESNYFEDVEDPYHLAEGSSDDGNLVAKNNYLDNSGSGETGGSVSSIPYSYTVDTASSVKSIVTAGAGVGVLDL